MTKEKCGCEMLKDARPAIDLGSQEMNRRSEQKTMSKLSGVVVSATKKLDNFV